MLVLWCITLLWAFSFSLIGHVLSGQVDTWLLTSLRSALALLVFLPWMLRHATPPWLAIQLAAIGSLQLGVMYAFFVSSFAYLSVAEVALFTIFTPLWIALLDDAVKRRLRTRVLLAATLAVLAAAIMRATALGDDWLTGFMLVQGANLCFALGQMAYRYLMLRWSPDLPAHTVFGWFFLGALLIALLGLVLQGDPSRMPGGLTQWLVVVWLGLAASGLGYFGWNQAATRVNVGQLAVMNNALVPMAIAVNWLIWQEPVALSNLLPGATLLLLALWLASDYRPIGHRPPGRTE